MRCTITIVLFKLPTLCLARKKNRRVVGRGRELLTRPRVASGRPLSTRPVFLSFFFSFKEQLGTLLFRFFRSLSVSSVFFHCEVYDGNVYGRPLSSGDVVKRGIIILLSVRQGTHVKTGRPMRESRWRVERAR